MASPLVESGIPGHRVGPKSDPDNQLSISHIHVMKGIHFLFFIRNGNREIKNQKAGERRRMIIPVAAFLPSNQAPHHHIMKILSSRRKKELKQWLIRSTWRPGRNYKPPCLWSKGISRYCDFKGPDSYWREDTESCQSESFFRKHYADAGGIVWVRLSTNSRNGNTCDLDNFVRGALPTIREPFVLVTTDGDSLVPSDIPAATVESLLDSPWLVSWHTQNHDGHPHPKFAPLPIGIDLHTPRFCTGPRRLVADLQRIRARRCSLDQLPLRVFCDLEVNLNSEERCRAVKALRNYDHVDFLGKPISQSAIWRRYAEYPFVLSVAGNGLDCHRTWELLYLGAIVITKTSSLDSLFDGLPVVIVEDWNAVGSKRNLSIWLEQFGRLTDQKEVWCRLAPDHLIRSIRVKLASFEAEEKGA